MEDNKLSFTEIIGQNSINLASTSNITAIEIFFCTFFIIVQHSNSLDL